MNKAVFLDRDGTINEEVNYLRRIKDIRIFPKSIEALQKFKNLGYLNIIITNQSGIARGFLTEEELNNIHTEFRKLLNVKGSELIDDIFYSPYHSEGIIEKYRVQSPDRKPETGMIFKAVKKYDINLEESFFIGDSYTDMKCAENSGLKKIMVMTGYGKEDFKKCSDENIKIDYIAENLYDASVFIDKLNKDIKPETLFSPDTSK